MEKYGTFDPCVAGSNSAGLKLIQSIVKYTLVMTLYCIIV
jgi:hypothetical protein